MCYNQHLHWCLLNKILQNKKNLLSCIFAWFSFLLLYTLLNPILIVVKLPAAILSTTVLLRRTLKIPLQKAINNLWTLASVEITQHSTWLGIIQPTRPGVWFMSIWFTVDWSSVKCFRTSHRSHSQNYVYKKVLCARDFLIILHLFFKKGSKTC